MLWKTLRFVERWGKKRLGPEKLKSHCINEAVLKLFGNSLNFQLAGPTGNFPSDKTHPHGKQKSSRITLCSALKGPGRRMKCSQE